MRWVESRSRTKQGSTKKRHRRRKLSLRKRRLWFSSRLPDLNLTFPRHLVQPPNWHTQAWWWALQLALRWLGAPTGEADRHSNLRRLTSKALIICNPRATSSNRRCILQQLTLLAMAGSSTLIRQPCTRPLRNRPPSGQRWPATTISKFLQVAMPQVFFVLRTTPTFQVIKKVLDSDNSGSCLLF